MDCVQRSQYHHRHAADHHQLTHQHPSSFVGAGHSQAILWLVTAALTGSVIIVFLSIACCGSQARRTTASRRRPQEKEKEKEVEEGNQGEGGGDYNYDDDEDEPLHYTMVFVARQPDRAATGEAAPGQVPLPGTGD